MCFYSAKICHDILFKRKYFISMNCWLYIYIVSHNSFKNGS
jgi:hypothetical protein